MSDEDVPEVHVQRPNSLHGELLPEGYVLPQGLTYDEWAAEGPTLVRMAQSAMWWVGDWLAYGEHHFGEKYVQAVEATGLALSTLKNAQWVADRIPPSERVESVPFSHHRAVASLDPKPRAELLAKVVEDGLSEHEVRARVREIKEAEAQQAGPGETVIEVPAEKSIEELLDEALVALSRGIGAADWGAVGNARDLVARARALVPEPVE